MYVARVVSASTSFVSVSVYVLLFFFFFFFNDTATTEIYTLSLHDAPPIWATGASLRLLLVPVILIHRVLPARTLQLYRNLHLRLVDLVVLDRKSTRLN